MRLRVHGIQADPALCPASIRARGWVCVQPDAKLGNSFARQSNVSFPDSDAKYQLGLFAVVSLLLFLAPASISIRNGASEVAQRLAFDATPWRQSILPSPLDAVERPIFVLPKPVGTAIPNFIDARFLQRDRVADASVQRKTFEEDGLEPTLTQKIALLIANRFGEFNPEIIRSEPQLIEVPPQRIRSASAIIQNGFPSLAPMGYVRFCQRYSEDCKIHGNDFRRRTVALTRERWAELGQVNREVNRDIISQPDGIEEADQNWLVNPAMGSCHDYAVTKRHDLLARGWPSSAILLSEVIVASGEHHLVLVVRTSRGNFVLDNLDSEIRPVDAVSYAWVRIQSKSNPKFWLAAIPERWPTLRERLGTVQTSK